MAKATLWHTRCLMKFERVISSSSKPIQAFKESDVLMKSMVDIIFCQSTPFKVEDILIYPTRRLKLRQNNLHTILDVEDTSRERERPTLWMWVAPIFSAHGYVLIPSGGGKTLPCTWDTNFFAYKQNLQDWEFLGETFRKGKVSSRLIWLLPFRLKKN